MGLPLFDESIDSSENYLRTKISQETWVTQSGTSLLDDLREIGFSITESKFFEIRRDVLNIIKHQEQIESLTENTPIPLGYMGQVPTWNLRSDYVYQVEYTYTVGDDPTQHKAWYSMSSNQQLSKEQIEDFATQDLADLKYEKNGKEITIGGVTRFSAYTKRTSA